MRNIAFLHTIIINVVNFIEINRRASFPLLIFILILCSSKRYNNVWPRSIRSPLRQEVLKVELILKLREIPLLPLERIPPEYVQNNDNVNDQVTAK